MALTRTYREMVADLARREEEHEACLVGMLAEAGFRVQFMACISITDDGHTVFRYECGFPTRETAEKRMKEVFEMVYPDILRSYEDIGAKPGDGGFDPYMRVALTVPDAADRYEEFCEISDRAEKMYPRYVSAMDGTEGGEE